jgi:hypothetical protein
VLKYAEFYDGKQKLIIIEGDVFFVGWMDFLESV